MENNIVSRNKYFKSRNNNRVTEPKEIEYSDMLDLDSML